jgi:hypothetical protein
MCQFPRKSGKFFSKTTICLIPYKPGLRAQAAEDPRFLRGCSPSTQTGEWAWRSQALP